MGTSRRRTRPAPVLAGPQGRPDRLPRQAKNEQIAVWFQRGKPSFPRRMRGKLFNSALLSKWINGPRYSSLIGSTRRLVSVR